MMITAIVVGIIAGCCCPLLSVWYSHIWNLYGTSYLHIWRIKGIASLRHWYFRIKKHKLFYLMAITIAKIDCLDLIDSREVHSGKYQNPFFQRQNIFIPIIYIFEFTIIYIFNSLFLSVYFFFKTNIAKVLISLNPQKDLKGLHNENMIKRYRANYECETDPHIYAIGNI